MLSFIKYLYILPENAEYIFIKFMNIFFRISI